MSVRDGEPVPIDAPVMRQAIAWQFVLRAVHLREQLAAEELLKAESGADDVMDIKVTQSCVRMLQSGTSRTRIGLSSGLK